MTLALTSDQLAGRAVSFFAARQRQNLRFDGLWWRKLAALGCGYGPEWVKRYLPAPTAAMIFVLVRLNRRAAIANMARIVGTTRRTEAALAALRMYAEFARCMTETMEYYGPSPQPIQVDLPERDGVLDALREGRGAVIVTGHFGNWDIAAKTLREHGRPINMVGCGQRSRTVGARSAVCGRPKGVRLRAQNHARSTPSLRRRCALLYKENGCGGCHEYCLDGFGKPRVSEPPYRVDRKGELNG